MSVKSISVVLHALNGDLSALSYSRKEVLQDQFMRISFLIAFSVDHAKTSMMY